MTVFDVDVPFDIRCELGEGPHWSAAHGLLRFVDINAGIVHELDPTTGDHREFDVASLVSLVLPVGESGDWLCGTRGDLVVLGADGRVGERHVIEADRPLNRINDGKADPAGRLWCGTMSLRWEPGQASLYCVGEDGLRTVLGDVTLSNGLGWDTDRARMYYVDSATQRVDVLRYDVATGAIEDRRPFAPIDPVDGLPDGLTLDADGCVWLALFGGGVLRRYDPDGALMAEITLPVRHPTSVAFGGDDLDTLFVTTSRHKLSEAERAASPSAGGLLVVDPGDVRGRAADVLSPAVAAAVRSLPVHEGRVSDEPGAGQA